MSPEPARPFQGEALSTHDLNVIRSWLAFYDELMHVSAGTTTDSCDLQSVRSRHQYWKRRYAERRAELA